MADSYPADLRYTDSDEWVRQEGDEAVTGVTHYAAEQLGDIVYLQLPDVGSSYGQGDTFGEIESVKAVSDLYSPIAGQILAVNEDLEQQPGLVNEDPYGKGWLVRIRPSDSTQVLSLLDASAYEQKVTES